jgi:hypothetical protein
MHWFYHYRLDREGREGLSGHMSGNFQFEGRQFL